MSPHRLEFIKNVFIQDFLFDLSRLLFGVDVIRKLGNETLNFLTKEHSSGVVTSQGLVCENLSETGLTG